MSEKVQPCANCDFCRSDFDKSAYVCYNEKSNNFGEVIEKPLQKFCGRYFHTNVKDLTLYSALNTVANPEITSSYSHFRVEKHDGKPYGSPYTEVFFENNEQLNAWENAMARLFCEIVEIEKGLNERKDTNKG